MVEVHLRHTCRECFPHSEGEGQARPDCPECKGTGWVEFWVSLAHLTNAIRDGEPIEAVALLEAQAKKWAGED